MVRSHSQRFHRMMNTSLSDMDLSIEKDLLELVKRAVHDNKNMNVYDDADKNLMDDASSHSMSLQEATTSKQQEQTKTPSTTRTKRMKKLRKSLTKTDDHCLHGSYNFFHNSDSAVFKTKFVRQGALAA
jgi:hypothetical protein